MAYWLLKSEPSTWSWDMQKKAGAKGQQWDGVRNYQARNNMRAMQIGDRAFFYHSNEGLAVVGIAEICGLVHQDTTTEDARWDCVDVRALKDMSEPVTLDAIKGNPKLAEMVLVVNSRLSVQPVRDAEWREVCRMGGLDPAP